MQSNRVLAADRPSRSCATAAVDALFPLMDSSSAVSPTIRIDGTTLGLAYYLPGCEDSAVVTFRDVSAWYYGGPNDEGLLSHPLWNRGLQFYNFHRADRQDSSICWAATFHDGTFEIQAQQATVLAERVQGASPSEALDSALGVGANEALDGHST